MYLISIALGFRISLTLCNLLLLILVAFVFVAQIGLWSPNCGFAYNASRSNSERPDKRKKQRQKSQGTLIQTLFWVFRERIITGVWVKTECGLSFAVYASNPVIIFAQTFFKSIFHNVNKTGHSFVWSSTKTTKLISSFFNIRISLSNYFIQEVEFGCRGNE